MSTVRLSLVLVAALTACGAADEPERPADPGRSGMTFTVAEAGGDRVWIRQRWGPTISAAGGSISSMTYGAAITVATGRRYFEIVDERIHGPRDAAYLHACYVELPEGREAVSFDGPPASGVGERNPLLDAQVLLDAMQITDARAHLERVDAASREPEPGGPEVVGEGLARRALGRVLEDDEARTLTWDVDAGGLWVCGRESAQLVDAAGEVLRRVTFDRRLVRPEPMSLDGALHFVDRGGGWSEVGLLDGGGRSLWQVPNADIDGAPNQLSWGDLDGDGAPEFVVGTNAGGGVHVLDADGALRASHPASNAFSVAVADVDGDGSNELLYASHGGVVVSWGDGRPPGALPEDWSGFELVTDPDGAPALADIRRGRLLVAHTDGEVFIKLPVVASGHDEPDLAWIHREDGPWLAVARTLGATSRSSELYVFDPTGDLRHHELVEASVTSVATAVDPETGREQLAVAGGDALWLVEVPD